MKIHTVAVVVLMIGAIHAHAGEQQSKRCPVASSCQQYSPVQFGDAYKASEPHLSVDTTNKGINYCPIPKVSIPTS